MLRANWTWKLSVLLALAYVCAQSAAQDIYYTGKLFGYYRIEPGEQSHLTPVTNFLAQDFANKGLLLGMGDNFGPEFGASIQFESPDCLVGGTPNPKATVPETLYKQESRYAKTAECDNVMNFLMHAGYRAVVPGREDFIYSANWLRRMAVSVRDPSEGQFIKNSENKLNLLAANLRLVSSDDLPKGAKPTCPLLFGKDLLGAEATLCTADNPNPAPEDIDWLERLDKASTDETRNAISDAMRLDDSDTNKFHPDSDTASARAVKNEFSILKSAWRKCDMKDVDKDATTKPAGLTRPSCSPDQLSSVELDDLNTYWNDFKNRLVGVFGTGGSQKGLYQHLLISTDAAKAAQRQLLRNIQQDLSDVGYITTGPSDQRVLIIGVVGKETMSAISQANLKVCVNGAGLVKCPQTAKDGRNFTVKVFDPTQAVVTAIRAASSNGQHFERVIVMAQMPAPEAEVLASMVRSRLGKLRSGLTLPSIDAVIAEAQYDYQSGTFTLIGVQPSVTTPILTPPAPASKDQMWGSVAHLYINASTYSNQIAFPAQVPSWKNTTTGEVRRLLHDRDLKADKIIPCPKPDPGRSLPDSPPDDPCGYATLLAVMSSLQRASKADLVLLEDRDIWGGRIYDGYGGGIYDARYCPQLSNGDLDHCLLRVALDRILWKGDYVERVAVTGADLKKILDTSSTQISGSNDLRVTDLYQQWLVTYGVTQPALTNLTKLSTGSDPQWIPGDSQCKRADQTDTSKTTYCVDGRPIAPDQIYWVATSDDLAEDKNLYTQLGALDPQNRKLISDFQTNASANALERIAGKKRKAPFPSNENEFAFINREFEQQPLFQIDYNKLILSFNNNHALGPTDQIPRDLQGVADSRAAVPHSQDVDLEASLRLISNHAYFMPIAIGTQTSTGYERSIKGNLSGSPESVSYPQNNATFGAFAQYTLSRHPHTRSRALPRELLVLTPHQFQTQMNNQRLFIGYSAKDANGKPITPGQLAVRLPLVSSFSDKFGYRHEWGLRKKGTWSPLQMDAGSYAEAGFEYSLQNNILQSLTLTDGTVPVPCSPTAEQDIASCFKNKGLIIDSSTKVVGPPATKSLHTPGGYWDIHLSRGLDMGVLKNLKPPLTLISDSQGDWFSGRPAIAELPTQTRYAITWNSSLNVPVWGNLSFGPTYNVFFYQPQLSTVHEQIRTLSFALRWYMARDQRVPWWIAPRFTGPASADQTKSSGKSK